MKGSTMKLKLNDQGFAVVRNGMPVYTHVDGREEAFDAAGAMKMLVGKHFESSAVAGGLKIPHEIAAAAFGDSFRIEKGQLVAYDKGDIPVYSHTRHGEVANFEEALDQLIDRYPNKEMIQRKDDAPGQQAGTGQTATITRVQFDALPAASRAKFFNEGGRINDSADAAATAAPTAVSDDGSGKRVINRTEFDAMPPRDRAMHFKNGGGVVD
jgi:hypothetical protein